MSVVQETTSKALPIVGAEVSFGTLSPNFDYLDVYVDPAGATSRIRWRLYATLPGAAPDLVVDSLPVPSQQGPYLPFASVQMIAGTTYEIKGIAVDMPITTPIVAGFAGSNAQVNTGVPDVATGAHKLVSNLETVFATIPVFHTQFQVEVDPNGSASTASTWKLYGIITGAGGTIRAQIAVGQFGEVTTSTKPYIVISTANDPLGQPLGRARGASSYQITGISLNAAGSTGPMKATLAGFDANVDIAGGSAVTPMAFAAGIIFQPVVGPPPPPSGSLFHVWGPGPGTVMGAIAQTQGNVNVEIDDSFVSPALVPSAGMPVGGWDMEGRVSLTSANPATDGAVLNVEDGATLKNLVGVSQLFLGGSPGASGLPSFSYTTPTLQVSFTAAAFLTQNGTRPLIDIADGTNIDVLANDFIEFLNASSGAEIFNLLGATSNLALIWTGGTTAQPATNIVAGVAGASLFFYRDISSGSFTVNPARFPGGNLNFFLMEGLEQKQSVQVAAGSTYVVDAAGFATGTFDEIIFCKPSPGPATQINLPDPTLLMNKGRILRVVDDNGGSVTSPIVLSPFPATNLNGAPAPMMLAQNWNQWLVTCDGVSWTVDIIPAAAPMATANNAFASGIIFAPGQLQVDNRFPVWGGAFPSVMGAFALTHGNVNIEIDDSALAATIPAAPPYDMQGRATLTDGNPLGTSTVTIQDGAQLLNLAGIRGDVTVEGAPTAVASLAFTGASRDFQMQEAAALFVTGGTRTMIDISSPRLFFIVDNSSLFPGAVGHEMFNMLPGSTVFVDYTNISTLTPADTLAVGTGTVIWTRDRSSAAPIFGAGFTGVGFISLQDGPDNRNSTIITGATTLVVDAAYATGAGFANQTIFCKPTVPGLTIQLPSAILPMNKGRVVKIVDDNGGSQANPISLVPFGAQLLNGVNLPQPLSLNWSQWEATCDGAEWQVNIDVDTVTTANNAFAAGIVYQPGGVNTNNVFNTWGGPFPSVMAALALTNGEVTIAIDNSAVAPAAAVIPAGIYDMQGRTTISSLTNADLTAVPIPFTPLTLADGAQLKNLRKFSGGLAVTGASAATSPLAFDLAFSVIENDFGVVINNNGTAPFVKSLIAGQTVFFVLRFQSTFTNTTVPLSGPLFDLSAATAMGLLSISNSPTALNSTNLVTGATGTFRLEGDSSIQVPFPASVGFTGTRAFVFYDHAQTASYNPLAASPAPTTFNATLGQPSVQTAIDVHRSPQRTVANNYVIDTLALDQTIFTDAPNINITLPLSTNWDGREITVKDITNGPIPPYYNLVPSGADKIEGSILPHSQISPLSSLVLKSDGAGNWWII